MSINLMSAIFRTEFRDLQDAEGNTTKASTAKFVCLALADHANDEGEGAYPSINKLAYKTSLSRSAVINALDAMKHNGILTANGASKWDTVNYTVNPVCFSQGSQPAILVYPIDSPQSTQLTPPVSPQDPNHPLTVLEPSLGVPPTYSIEWQIGTGKETITVQDDFQARAIDSANLIAMGTGINARAVYEIAMAFQMSRKKLFTESDIKGQRKAAKVVVEKHIAPTFIVQAVNQLIEAGMTVSDLYSVIKTADSLANPTPETTGYNPQGLDLS